MYHGPWKLPAVTQAGVHSAANTQPLLFRSCSYCLLLQSDATFLVFSYTPCGTWSLPIVQYQEFARNETVELATLKGEAEQSKQDALSLLRLSRSGLGTCLHTPRFAWWFPENTTVVLFLFYYFSSREHSSPICR